MEMQKKLGNYTFEKQIGSGAFATVYLGRDDRTGRPVAIKMISRSNPRADPVAIEKEVHVLMKLQHPNIVKLYEFQKTQNNFYLIFEFCKHGDLQGFIKSNFPKACVPEHQAQKLAQQILAGIKAMKDKKIVHRDLKCANILVADDFVLKIADFGFARFVEAANPLLESYLGTPLTMGPEVLMKTGYDDKCDIWSLGVIIYQIIFGKFPFEPRIPSLDSLIEAINKPGALQFPSHIPLTPAAKELISAMLTVDPKARISFDDLFEHPWVTGSFSVPDPDNNLINLNASALLKSAYDNRHNVKPGDSKDPSKKPKPSTTKPFEGSVAIPKNTQEQGGDKKPQPHSGEDANQRLWNEVFGGIVVAMLAKLVRSRSQNILSLARRVEKTLTLVQTADFLNEDLQNPKYLRTHILLQTLAAMKSAMVVELGLTHEKSDKVYYNTSVQDICDIYTKNVGILKSLVAIEDQKPDLFDEMKSQFNTLYQMLKKETRHFTEDALRGVDSKEFLISSLLDLSKSEIVNTILIFHLFNRREF